MTGNLKKVLSKLSQIKKKQQFIVSSTNRRITKKYNIFLCISLQHISSNKKCIIAYKYTNLKALQRLLQGQTLKKLVN